MAYINGKKILFSPQVNVSGGGDYDQGYNDGYVDGKQAEYDAFWDNVQYLKGEPQPYLCVFGTPVWCKDIFKPKYNIVPTLSTQMFNNFGQYHGGYMDLVERLNECGVIMDTSRSTRFSSMFAYAAINHVGVLDCSGTTRIDTMFANAINIVKVDKLIVHEGITTYTNAFQNATELANITIEGTIAANGVDVSSCPLTHESIMSFIYALKDFSGTTETRSITFGATNLAKLTDAEKQIATGKGWTLL